MYNQQYPPSYGQGVQGSQQYPPSYGQGVQGQPKPYSSQGANPVSTAPFYPQQQTYNVQYDPQQAQPVSYVHNSRNQNNINPNHSVDVDTVGTASFATFDDKTIRNRFIRKVYLILATQMLVTTAIIAYCIFHIPTKNWIQAHSWIYYLSFAFFIGTYIALMCCPNVRRKTPGNYICIVILTLSLSYMTALISSFYDVEAVLISAGITCGVCVGVTLFSMQTKIDFTRCSGLLLCLLIVLILFGISISLVFAFADPDERTAKILQVVYGSVGAAVFSLMLAYNTQMILGGRKHQYSEEDYASAAVELYLDCVYIFTFILGAVGNSN